MRKSMLLAMLLLAVSAVPAFAEIEGVAGAKFDAPNIVRFNDNWTFGVEGGKNLYNVLSNDASAWVEDDRGYFGYAKITYTGTWFGKK